MIKKLIKLMKNYFDGLIVIDTSKASKDSKVGRTVYPDVELSEADWMILNNVGIMYYHASDKYTK